MHLHEVLREGQGLEGTDDVGKVWQWKEPQEKGTELGRAEQVPGVHRDVKGRRWWWKTRLKGRGRVLVPLTIRRRVLGLGLRAAVRC